MLSLNNLLVTKSVGGLVLFDQGNSIFHDQIRIPIGQVYLPVAKYLTPNSTLNLRHVLTILEVPLSPYVVHE